MKIALTATPALHTTEIFGQPVFKYTYREAVIEGYLVDHDAPHHMERKLSTGGIHYKSGDTVTISVSYTHLAVNQVGVKKVLRNHSFKAYLKEEEHLSLIHI